jgi:DNA-binding CsgD family transcriptional regulator
MLSPRERQICMLVVEGFSDANIAARLSIKEATVGSHLARIYRKLRVHSRVQLARVSAHLGGTTLTSNEEEAE